MALYFNNQEFDGVLWDLDNTLVRVTEDYILTAVATTLRHFGQSPPKGFSEKFWYEGGRSKLVQEMLGINPEEFWPIFNEVDSSEARGAATTIYDDVHETLDALSKVVRQGIVTASPRDKALRSVEKLGPHYFGSVISAHFQEGVAHKPDPEGLVICMQQLGLSPERVLYVGDTGEDILTARNAGTTSCLIERGSYSVSIEPDVRIKSLRELVGGQLV